MDEIIETLAKANPDDAMAQFRLARSRRQLGFVAAQNWAIRALARPIFARRSRSIAAVLPRSPTKTHFLRELANSLGQLAAAEMVLGHLDKAHEMYRDEVQIRDRFSEALAADEDSRRELAGLYEKLAELSLRMKRPEEGKRYYDLTAEKRLEFLAEHPTYWPAVYDVARTYNNAGFVHYPAGQ